MRKPIILNQMSQAEKLAKAHFEYMGWEDLWMDDAWEELPKDVREQLTERMRAAIEHAHLG